MYVVWEKRLYCNLRLFATAGKETLAEEEFKNMKQVIFHKDGLVEIDLHQVIAAQSPQLARMMEDKKKYAKKSFLKLVQESESEQDVSGGIQIGFDEDYIEAGALIRCVKFMYTGKLDVSSRNVTALLNASHYLGLKQAETLCIQFMVQTLNPGNALSLAAIGKLLKCGELEDKADHFLSQNFTAVSDSLEWGDLRKTAVEAILRRSDLVCKSEMDVIKAIYSWGIAPFTSGSSKDAAMEDKDDVPIGDDETVESRVGAVCEWVTSDLVRCVHLSDKELAGVRQGCFFLPEAKAATADAHERLLEACVNAVEREYRHRNDRGITRAIPELRQYDYDR